MVAAVRCAPPANAPTPAERDACSPWLDAELAFVLPSLRVVVCLGSFGWDSVWRTLGRVGVAVPRPRPRFGHAVRVTVHRPAASAGGPADGRQVDVLGCYHPSQQNTFTGKLTESMLDEVLGNAAALAELER
jgi:uracil-DNA glycosylase